MVKPVVIAAALSMCLGTLAGCASSGERAGTSSPAPTAQELIARTAAPRIRGLPTLSVRELSAPLVMRQTKVNPTPTGSMEVVVQVPITTTLSKQPDGGYVVRWTRGKSELVSVKRNGVAITGVGLDLVKAQSMATIAALDDMELVLRFNSKWEYVGLVDDRGARRAAERTVDAMSQMRAKFGGPPLSREDIEMMTSKPMLENTLPAEAILFFKAPQFVLARAAGDAFEAATPNPMNPQVTVPIRVDTSASRADVDGNTSHLVVRTTSSGRDILKLLDSTPGAAPLTPNDRAEIEKVTLTSQGEYHLMNFSGFPIYAKVTMPQIDGKPSPRQEYEWTMRSR